MYIITLIPIYRNKFQKEILFFSVKKFNLGTLVFVPYPKKESPEKPALIIDTVSTKETKQFLRKSSLDIEKIKNTYNLEIISPEKIKEIQEKSLKIKKNFSFSLNQIFPKKIIKELNSFSETKNPQTILDFTKKIDTFFINQKLKKFLPQKAKVPQQKEVQNISSLLKIHSEKTKLHTEKHYLVDEIRKYFGETATKGKGSFSFYLGFFKKIPKNIIYQYWSEVKTSRKSIKQQQKIFWWKIGQYLKKK